MKQVLILISLLMIFRIGHATTVTFDPALNPGGQKGMAEYSENDFIFSVPTHGFIQFDSGSLPGVVPDNGTAHIGFAHQTELFPAVPLTISHANDLLFTLHNVDLAHYSIYFNTDIVPFIGNRADGSTVYQSFSLADSINFSNFSFDSSFSNLLNVEVHVEGYAMDNVVLTSVPLPSSVVFLFSGLSLLYLTVKRKWC